MPLGFKVGTSETKLRMQALRSKLVGNRSRRREEKRLGLGFGKWDSRGGRERGFTMKKKEMDKWDHGDSGVDNRKMKWNNITDA